ATGQVAQRVLRDVAEDRERVDQLRGFDPPRLLEPEPDHAPDRSHLPRDESHEADRAPDERSSDEKPDQDEDQPRDDPAVPQPDDEAAEELLPIEPARNE